MDGAVDRVVSSVAFISSDAHPTTGKPLISPADGRRHYEIFRGETRDAGKTWKWTLITRDSSEDNLRPIVPIWRPGRTVLLWLRGSYSTYRDYDLDVVALIED